MKFLKYIALILILLNLSCKEKLEYKKIPFYDYINRNRDVNIETKSINNLNKLSGFRNLVLGRKLDGIYYNDVNFSYMKNISKSDITILSENLYFLEFKNGWNTESFKFFIRLYFHKGILSKIELINRSEPERKAFNGDYYFLKNFNEILGESSNKKKYNCEKLSKDQYLNSFFSNKKIKEINCDYKYEWFTNLIKLSYEKKASSSKKYEYEYIVCYELVSFKNQTENVNNILKIDSLKVKRIKDSLINVKNKLNKRNKLNKAIKNL